MKTLGVVLVILGALALAYGGFDYTRDRSVLSIGSAEIVATESRHVPVPAVVGAIMLVGGVALLVMGNRRNLRA